MNTSNAERTGGKKERKKKTKKQTNKKILMKGQKERGFCGVLDKVFVVLYNLLVVLLPGSSRRRRRRSTSIVRRYTHTHIYMP
jgi:hypothetical protein